MQGQACSQASFLFCDVGHRRNAFSSRFWLDQMAERRVKSLPEQEAQGIAFGIFSFAAGFCENEKSQVQKNRAKRAAGGTLRHAQSNLRRGLWRALPGRHFVKVWRCRFLPEHSKTRNRRKTECPHFRASFGKKVGQCSVFRFVARKGRTNRRWSDDVWKEGEEEKHSTPGLGKAILVGVFWQNCLRSSLYPQCVHRGGWSNWESGWLLRRRQRVRVPGMSI